MTRDDFVAWHERQGFKSLEEGAATLHVSLSTYKNYMSGVSRTTGKPVDYTFQIAMTCAGIEAGLKPLASPAHNI